MLPYLVTVGAHGSVDGLAKAHNEPHTRQETLNTGHVRSEILKRSVRYVQGGDKNMHALNLFFKYRYPNNKRKHLSLNLKNFVYQIAIGA